MLCFVVALTCLSCEPFTRVSSSTVKLADSLANPAMFVLVEISSDCIHARAITAKALFSFTYLRKLAHADGRRVGERTVIGTFQFVNLRKSKIFKSVNIWRQSIQP